VSDARPADPWAAAGEIPAFLRRTEGAIPSHPLAEIFPLMEGEAFADLVEDIRANGLHEEIVLYEGKILDGRNRYLASRAAGVAPRFETYTGSDPLGYVISLNLKRRHLDESQRAMVAAKLATMRQGARTDLSPIGEMSQGQAAELLNVGKRSVERAADVRERGAPELITAVERGAVSVSAAADIASLSRDEQRALLANFDGREIIRVAMELRAKEREVRREERIARIAEISKSTPAFPRGRFPVVYADPPWKMTLDEIGGLKSFQAHYPNMETADICALSPYGRRVSDLAPPDAILFLWAIPSMLPAALEVMGAWGFEYVSQAVWVKNTITLGFYVRYQHELLLIGRRGDIPTPPEHERPSSVLDARRREHSQKPDEARALIERMYPDLPKIELFARGEARPGWVIWGNQAEAAE
jgi:N6-adenosine-specific RNA methylase IME4